uniref:Truncated glycoprotein n=1 Tax=Spring viremia of carp virus TaxID=696863 RepID=G8XP32_SVCV|nr:truncated glycoprotein [Sprivivirus cyprinus]
MSIISYIAFFLLIDSNLGIPIFVPSGRNISWQPVIQPFDYQCPIHGNLPNTMGLSATKLTIKSPSVFSTDKVSGWICHAAEWKTLVIIDGMDPNTSPTVFIRSVLP